MKHVALAAAALIAASLSAQAATITPASGENLTRNVTQDSAVQVFSEQTDVIVGSGSVTVDYLVGTNLTVGATANGISTFSSGQSLTAGTYDSFLVHFDPNGSGSISNIFVDFGSTIVGLIVSNSGTQNLLERTDATFGTAASYDTHIGRRTEDSDSFTLTSATSLTLNLSTNANHIDNIRVLTLADVAAVPLPASLPLLLAGLGGLVISRRRR